MPSIAAHMVIAKLVSDNLNINNEDFIRGNLLPDITSDIDSHHRKMGKMFYTVDIDYFKNKLDLNNPLYLGYYTHLLLDSYFEEEYLPSTITYTDIFKDRTMYKEYDLINYEIVKKFNLDVEYLTTILKKYNVDINKEKLDLNIKCLSNTQVGETKYLKFEPFSDFLLNISNVISDEIRNYVSTNNTIRR